MKIKLDITAVDELPKSLQELCEENENGIFIDSEVLKTDNDISNMKEVLKKERDLRREAEAEAKKVEKEEAAKLAKLQDELEQLKAGTIDPEDVKKSKEELKTYWEKKLAKQQEEAILKAKELENKLAEKENFIIQTQRETLIRKHTSKDARPEAMEFIVQGISPLLVFDEQTNEFVSKDGVSPVKETCDKFLEANPFFVKNSDSGGANGNRGNNPKQKKWEEMTLTEKATLRIEDPKLYEQIAK